MPTQRAANDEYSPDLVQIGARVRELRHEGRWGVGTLAAEAGLHWTYVREVESGPRNVSVVTLFKLADALGVGTCSLLPADRRGRASRSPGKA